MCCHLFPKAAVEVVRSIGEARTCKAPVSVAVNREQAIIVAGTEPVIIEEDDPTVLVATTAARVAEVGERERERRTSLIQLCCFPYQIYLTCRCVTGNAIVVL